MFFNNKELFRADQLSQSPSSSSSATTNSFMQNNTPAISHQQQQSTLALLSQLHQQHQLQLHNSNDHSGKSAYLAADGAPSPFALLNALRNSSAKVEIVGE